MFPFSFLAQSLQFVNANEYVNSTDQDQNTALHLAVEAGNLESVSLCLESGAEVNAARANAVTSLHIAALKGNLPIVRLLVDKGANIKTRDFERKTALHKYVPAFFIVAFCMLEAMICIRRCNVCSQ